MAQKKVDSNAADKPAPKAIIGVDEAGRGCVMGPLVVAAVKVPEDKVLRELKVRDSKELDRATRASMAKSIMGIANVELEIVPAEVIDSERERKTLNYLEVEVFAKVIKRLMEPGDVVFVDAADVNEGEFGYSIMKEIGMEFEIVSRHKADVIYPVVSAASIVAKNKRDAEMSLIEKALRTTLDIRVGSGYSSDPYTIAFIENWIKQEGNLPPYIRKSWETSRRLLELSKIKKLDEFG